MASTVMTDEIVAKVAEWVGKLVEHANYGTSKEKVRIIFHGGEPLLAGHAFYRNALPTIKKNIGRPVSFSLVSNLWAFDKEYAEILKEYNVSIGVSIDGPEEINDRQRGKGYFKRTMKSLQLVRNMGVPVCAICTFTPLSAPKVNEIFDFFLENKLNVQFKTVVEPFRDNGKIVETLTYEEHISLVKSLLTRFFEQADQIRVPSMERLVRSIVTHENTLYILGNCDGKQLAFDPKGGIYYCQRFAGIKKFQIASVEQQLAMEQLRSTPGYSIFSDRMEHVRKECSGCSYFNICAGGCAYNVFAGQSGKDNGSFKDSACSINSGILDTVLSMVENIMAQGTCMQKKMLYMLFRGIPLSQLNRDGTNLSTKN